MLLNVLCVIVILSQVYYHLSRKRQTAQMDEVTWRACLYPGEEHHGRRH
jgi:hypothetical protein